MHRLAISSMDESITQPAINELPDFQPVILPDASLTLPDRVANIEADLDITN